MEDTKPYCGIGKTPKGKHIGSMTECIEQKKVARFGLNKVPEKALTEAKKGAKTKKHKEAVENILRTIMNKAKKLQEEYNKLKSTNSSSDRLPLMQAKYKALVEYYNPLFKQSKTNHMKINITDIKKKLKQIDDMKIAPAKAKQDTKTKVKQPTKKAKPLPEPEPETEDEEKDNVPHRAKIQGMISKQRKQKQQAIEDRFKQLKLDKLFDANKRKNMHIMFDSMTNNEQSVMTTLLDSLGNIEDDLIEPLTEREQKKRLQAQQKLEEFISRIYKKYVTPNKGKQPTKKGKGLSDDSYISASGGSIITQVPDVKHDLPMAGTMSLFNLPLFELRRIERELRKR